MAFTSSDLTALDSAIKGGTLSVRYADRSVTYRTLSEMLALRALMRRELASEAPKLAHKAKFSRND